MCCPLCLCQHSRLAAEDASPFTPRTVHWLHFWTMSVPKHTVRARVRQSDGAFPVGRRGFAKPLRWWMRRLVWGKEYWSMRKLLWLRHRDDDRLLWLWSTRRLLWLWGCSNDSGHSAMAEHRSKRDHEGKAVSEKDYRRKSIPEPMRL